MVEAGYYTNYYMSLITSTPPSSPFPPKIVAHSPLHPVPAAPSTLREAAHADRQDHGRPGGDIDHTLLLIGQCRIGLGVYVMDESSFRPA